MELPKITSRPLGSGASSGVGKKRHFRSGDTTSADNQRHDPCHELLLYSTLLVYKKKNKWRMIVRQYEGPWV